MCYHFKQSKKKKELEKKTGKKVIETSESLHSNHFNGFDFPKTPVITAQESEIIQPMEWGLIPHWANEDWKREFTLNARSETIEEKPSFASVTANRCLILANGFYEWRHVGSKKQKHLMDFKDEIFAFAGLYDFFNNEPRYTILTTEAKGIMEKVHHTKLRMPIVLKSMESMHNWLDKNVVDLRFDFNVYPKIVTQGSLF